MNAPGGCRTLQLRGAPAGAQARRRKDAGAGPRERVEEEDLKQAGRDGVDSLPFSHA